MSILWRSWTHLTSVIIQWWGEGCGSFEKTLCIGSICLRPDITSAAPGIMDEVQLRYVSNVHNSCPLPLSPTQVNIHDGSRTYTRKENTLISSDSTTTLDLGVGEGNERQKKLLGSKNFQFLMQFELTCFDCLFFLVGGVKIIQCSCTL